MRIILFCSEKLAFPLVESTPPLFLRLLLGEMGSYVSLLPAMAFAPVSIRYCFPWDVEIAPKVVDIIKQIALSL